MTGRRQGEASPMFAEATQSRESPPRQPSSIANTILSGPAPRAATPADGLAAATHEDIANFIDSSPMFKFGQYKGERFAEVCKNAPEYYFWSAKQKSPGKFLTEYIAYVHKHYEIAEDEQTLQLDIRKHLRPTSVSQSSTASSTVTKKNRAMKYAKVPQCDVCTDFSRAGSNSFVERKTCKVCGTITQTKIERICQDPTTCQHRNLTRLGST